MKVVIASILSILFGLRALSSLFPMTMEHYSENILSIIGYCSVTLLLIAFSWNSYKEAAEATDNAIEKNRIEKETKEQRKKLTINSTSDEIIVRYLGGSGYEIPLNSNNYLAIMQDELKFISVSNEVNSIKFQNVTSFEIGGPGKTTTNAGITGGGFGIEGFIKGEITAAVINKITESSSVNTLFKILTKEGELYFHTSACEPDQLRMMLSPLAVQIANRSTNSGIGIADELGKLNNLLVSGAITKEDFDIAKNKLLK
ncbi:MAG: SHOCT domain-containing protein [Betaproteobacteria bacterium]